MYLFRLMLLRMDPERAHNLLTKIVTELYFMPRILAFITWWHTIPDRYKKPITRCGITFPHRVGMAAGFDKQGLLLRFLQMLGFGFVEVGTVLPSFQEGNPLPRVFRIPEQLAIVNRMGFNSLGAAFVKWALNSVSGQIRIPVGISLGMMKGTDLREAWKQYVEVLELLYELGDYFVINVSSPNTPELRDLQQSGYLVELTQRVVEASRRLGGKPILVKFDPDATDEATLAMIQAAVEGGASGVIIANTSTTIKVLGDDQKGGTSGEPIFKLTLSKVRLVRAAFPNLFIIAAGGIVDAEKALRMIQAGADLIQIYTGFIYFGPRLIRRILKHLTKECV